MKPSILIADDDSRVLTALKLLLKAESFAVTAVSSPAQLLIELPKQDYAIALIDLNYHRDTTSGNEGLQLISSIRALDEHLPIVVMTGYGSVDLAVAAMKLGAVDFVQKPWGNERLLAILKTQIQLGLSHKQNSKLVEQNALLRSELSLSGAQIIAHSPKMRQLLSQAEKLAKSEMNILITGDNGTGKSMLAHYLHQCSGRAKQSFVSVNMGAISENLFESEMFGHVKGAFTDAKEQRIGRFELADAGTIFLDEIANIPCSQQAKLLRVLEQHQFEKVGSAKTQQVNVRVISATNASIEQMISQETFRQDLWYRLNTVEINIPALKQRLDDIIPLAEFYLRKFAEKYRLNILRFDAQAQQALLSYDWPGNIRELSHIIERAIFLTENNVIKLADLTLAGTTTPSSKLSAPSQPLCDATLDEIEREVITQRMQTFDNNPLSTAESLGLSRSAYYRRLEKYGL
jgi:DNA-binding NtrC family response regulator